jgi:hypothetical protein
MEVGAALFPAMKADMGAARSTERSFIPVYPEDG